MLSTLPRNNRYKGLRASQAHNGALLVAWGRGVRGFAGSCFIMRHSEAAAAIHGPESLATAGDGGRPWCQLLDADSATVKDAGVS